MTPELAQLLAQEEAIHDNVKFAVRDAALAQRGISKQNFARAIVDIRGEASTASARDLPSLLDQLNTSQALANRSRKMPLPDLRAPYFAHMIVQDAAGQKKDILLGHDSLIAADRNVYLVDWKNTPMAKVFFNYRKGESYEVEINDDQFISGKVLERIMLRFARGELLGIESDDVHLQKNNGLWEEVSSQAKPELHGGAESAIRGFGATTGIDKPWEVSARLDPSQWSAIQSETDRPLLILGGAGSGKTTVALHRAAWLFAQDAKIFAQHKQLVLVPETGLRRLTEKLLKSLRLDRVVVATLNEWLHTQAKHIFPSSVAKLCSETPARVSRLKRHPAVFTIFPDLMKMKAERLAEFIGKKLTFIPGAPEQFMLLAGQHRLGKAIDLFCHWLESTATPEQSKKYQRVLEGISTDLTDLLLNVSIERQNLMTNRNLLMKIVQASGGQLDDKMVDDVIAHSHEQLHRGETFRSEDVDADYAMTLDQRDIEETEEDEDIFATMDPEELPILFELLFFYSDTFTTEGKVLHTFAHLILDEAQELDFVEMRFLRRILDPGAALTIAGDMLQQTNPFSQHATWDELLAAMQLGKIQKHELKVSYRCTAQIRDFSYQIMLPAYPNIELPESTKSGDAVIISRPSDDGHAVALIRDILEDLLRKEKRASVAVIAANEESAKLFYRGLSDLERVHFVSHGAFSFSPGVEVSEVSEVRGLEFDYVIIPDCDSYRYPDTKESRRMLHVAATRAIHQLWVLAPKVPSKILGEFAGGLHNIFNMAGTVK